MISKDEADDPEEYYFTLDLHIIQRAKIVKAANVHDVNLKISGARAGESHANTDNAKLFELAKIVFGETSLWVHAKSSQRNRDRRQALKLIWYNQFRVHALDERNAKNHKDIHVLAYHGKKKRHNWQYYVLGHKKRHGVQTALFDQYFNDFTDQEKVTFLINIIKCDTLDSVISIVSGVAAHADFEAFQLMIAKHIRMVTERSKFSISNDSAIYAACGNQPGCGDCGKCGDGGSGGRRGGSGMLNGEWDKRGISNGGH